MTDIRILVFAYACDPLAGSEPGVGWNWTLMLSQLGETWVITRKNNQVSIEEALADLPERPPLRFEFVDLPTWMRFWKRGRRGLYVYYTLWQFAAILRARRLKREASFDLVWHLTLANAWAGSGAALVGKPFIYGPVGGGVEPPWRLVTSLGLRGALFEVIRSVARFAVRYVNPLARASWRRADLILVQNPETRAWFPKRYRHKCEVFPNPVLPVFPPREHRPESAHGPTALFAGRLVPWKGVALAIRAISLLPKWRFLIFGAGSDEARLKRLARRWRSEGRVEFRGQVPRSEILEMLRSGQVDAFLFPSLHDDGPWAVAEALSCGVPVVCLRRGGPSVLGGSAVQPSSPKETARAMAAGLAALNGKAIKSTEWTMANRLRLLTDLLSQRGLYSTAQARTELLREPT
jgi:glycosyltransferase involved in cell wall biosynthesis